MSISKAFILFSLLSVTLWSINVRAENCLIVITSGSVSRPFWSEIVDGARKAGKDLGYTLYVRGTVNDMDPTGQKFILHSLIDTHDCQGILIAPSDASRNVDIATIKEQQKLPTVYIDRDTGGERVASVTTDNYAAGELAATKISELLHGKGKIVLFRIQQGVASTDLRESGFISQAKKLGLEIVASPYVGTRVGEARSRVSQTLSDIDHIDGIFTPNDTTTISTLLVRKALQKHKDVIHIGFDQTPLIIESTQNRELTGYITQTPYDIGYQGMVTLHNAIEKNVPTQDIKIPAVYVDK